MQGTFGLSSSLGFFIIEAVPKLSVVEHIFMAAAINTLLFCKNRAIFYDFNNQNNYSVLA